MANLLLSQGQVALVDDADFEYLNQWKWSCVKDGNTQYAIRHIRKDGKRTTISMHRQLLKTPKGYETDHINRNGLDNRRINLRLATTAQNQWNRRPLKNRSGYEGVRWDRGKWRIDMTVNNKPTYFGRFSNIKDAVLARKLIKQKYHGEFADG